MEEMNLIKKRSSVIVIRGAPGIGKTTTGRLLKNLNTGTSHIDVDRLSRMFNGERFIAGENYQYLHAIDHAGEISSWLIQRGIGPVIVSDVFVESVYERFVNKLQGANILLFTLIADNSILGRRMAERDSGYLNFPVARDINNNMISSRLHNELLIDTTHIGPTEVAALIEARI